MTKESLKNTLPIRRTVRWWVTKSFVWCQTVLQISCIFRLISSVSVSSILLKRDFWCLENQTWVCSNTTKSIVCSPMKTPLINLSMPQTNIWIKLWNNADACQKWSIFLKCKIVSQKPHWPPFSKEKMVCILFSQSQHHSWLIKPLKLQFISTKRT